METLSLPPGSAGYAVGDLGDRIGGRLDGAKSRIRTNVVNIVRLLDVQWVCNPAQYNIIRAAARANNALGGPVFEVSLILDDATPTTRWIKFAPGSIRTQSIDGNQYIVTAKVYAISPTSISAPGPTFPYPPNPPAPYPI